MTISLQACTTCGALQYPRRVVCRLCLASAFAERENSGDGVLAAVGTVHRSLETRFAPILPAVIGKAVLDCGVHVVCFAAAALVPGARITLTAETDETGAWLFHARPPA